MSGRYGNDESNSITSSLAGRSRRSVGYNANNSHQNRVDGKMKNEKGDGITIVSATRNSWDLNSQPITRTTRQRNQISSASSITPSVGNETYLNDTVNSVSRKKTSDTILHKIHGYNQQQQNHGSTGWGNASVVSTGSAEILSARGRHSSTVSISDAKSVSRRLTSSASVYSTTRKQKLTLGQTVRAASVVSSSGVDADGDVRPKRRKQKKSQSSRRYHHLNPDCCVKVALRVHPEPDDIPKCIEIKKIISSWDDDDDASDDNMFIYHGVRIIDNRDEDEPKEQEFNFDQIFDVGTTHDEIYAAAVAPLVESTCCQGYNATILAYGETATGKTHTLLGPSQQNSSSSVRNAASSDNDYQKAKKLSSPSSKFTSSSNRKTVPKAVSSSASCASSVASSLAPSYSYGDNRSNDNQSVVSEKDLLPSSVGVIPRALHSVFRLLESMKQTINTDVFNFTYCIRIQFLEIYNNEILDLLATAQQQQKPKSNIDINAKNKNAKITLRWVGPDPPQVIGAVQPVVESADEAWHWLRFGRKFRHVAKTDRNATSSRSHAIFTLLIEQRSTLKSIDTVGGGENVSVQEMRSKLNFVDLAAPQRNNSQDDKKIDPVRHKEQCEINQSLLTLRLVIRSLVEQQQQEMELASQGGASSTKRVSPQKRIPYRDSKLTSVLQGSLGGDHKVVMIACISPAVVNVEQSWECLKYMDKIQHLENKPASHIDNYSQVSHYSHPRYLDEWSCAQSIPSCNSTIQTKVTHASYSRQNYETPSKHPILGLATQHMQVQSTDHSKNIGKFTTPNRNSRQTPSPTNGGKLDGIKGRMNIGSAAASSCQTKDSKHRYLNDTSSDDDNGDDWDATLDAILGDDDDDDDYTYDENRPNIDVVLVTPSPNLKKSKQLQYSNATVATVDETPGSDNEKMRGISPINMNESGHNIEDMQTPPIKKNLFSIMDNHSIDGTKLSPTEVSPTGANKYNDFKPILEVSGRQLDDVIEASPDVSARKLVGNTIDITTNAKNNSLLSTEYLDQKLKELTTDSSLLLHAPLASTKTSSLLNPSTASYMESTSKGGNTPSSSSKNDILQSNSNPIYIATTDEIDYLKLLDDVMSEDHDLDEPLVDPTDDQNVSQIVKTDDTAIVENSCVDCQLNGTSSSVCDQHENVATQNDVLDETVRNQSDSQTENDIDQRYASSSEINNSIDSDFGYTGDISLAGKESVDSGIPSSKHGIKEKYYQNQSSSATTSTPGLSDEFLIAHTADNSFLGIESDSTNPVPFHDDEDLSTQNSLCGNHSLVKNKKISTTSSKNLQLISDAKVPNQETKLSSFENESKAHSSLNAEDTIMLTSDVSIIGSLHPEIENKLQVNEDIASESPLPFNTRNVSNFNELDSCRIKTESENRNIDEVAASAENWNSGCENNLISEDQDQARLEKDINNLKVDDLHRLLGFWLCKGKDTEEIERLQQRIEYLQLTVPVNPDGLEIVDPVNSDTKLGLDVSAVKPDVSNVGGAETSPGNVIQKDDGEYPSVQPFSENLVTKQSKCDAIESDVKNSENTEHANDLPSESAGKIDNSLTDFVVAVDGISNMMEEGEQIANLVDTCSLVTSDITPEKAQVPMDLKADVATVKIKDSKHSLSLVDQLESCEVVHSKELETVDNQDSEAHIVENSSVLPISKEENSNALFNGEAKLDSEQSVGKQEAAYHDLNETEKKATEPVSSGKQIENIDSIYLAKRNSFDNTLAVDTFKADDLPISEATTFRRDSDASVCQINEKSEKDEIKHAESMLATDDTDFALGADSFLLPNMQNDALPDSIPVSSPHPHIQEAHVQKAHIQELSIASINCEDGGASINNPEITAENSRGEQLDIALKQSFNGTSPSALLTPLNAAGGESLTVNDQVEESFEATSIDTEAITLTDNMTSVSSIAADTTIDKRTCGVNTSLPNSTVDELENSQAGESSYIEESEDPSKVGVSPSSDSTDDLMAEPELDHDCSNDQVLKGRLENVSIFCSDSSSSTDHEVDAMLNEFDQVLVNQEQITSQTVASDQNNIHLIEQKFRLGKELTEDELRLLEMMLETQPENTLEYKFDGSVPAGEPDLEEHLGKETMPFPSIHQDATTTSQSQELKQHDISKNIDTNVGTESNPDSMPSTRDLPFDGGDDNTLSKVEIERERQRQEEYAAAVEITCCSLSCMGRTFEAYYYDYGIEDDRNSNAIRSDTGSSSHAIDARPVRKKRRSWMSRVMGRGDASVSKVPPPLIAVLPDEQKRHSIDRLGTIKETNISRQNA